MKQDDQSDIIAQLREENAELRKRLAPLSPHLGDLSDLPQELIDELATPQINDLDQQIVDVVRAYGGTADLDQILVGLYRKFGAIKTRRYLQNKAWRCAQQGLLRSIKGRKGLYSLHEPEEAEEP